MANSGMARFVMEVAPPQIVSVMRHRTFKMLDTINEEDHKDFANDHSLLSSNLSISASSRPVNCLVDHPANAYSSHSYYFQKILEDGLFVLSGFLAIAPFMVTDYKEPWPRLLILVIGMSNIVLVS
ncbi:hypothetical protein ACFE04_012931 [Oxalis oulophora]